MVHTRQSLITAFNKANAFKEPLQLADVTFGTPVVFLQNLCNSRVLINAKGTSVNFKGSKYVFYNRRRLDDMLRGLKVPGRAADYPTTRDVAAKLQAVYGVPIDADDITGAAVIPGSTTVSLQPRGDCVGFFTQYPAVLSFKQ